MFSTKEPSLSILLKSVTIKGHIQKMSNLSLVESNTALTVGADKGFLIEHV